MAISRSFSCHGAAKNFVIATASNPPTMSPAGHHAWHATIFFVFSVLYIDASSGLITPSTRPCDRPKVKKPANNIVVPRLSKSDTTGRSGCGARMMSSTPVMNPAADKACKARMPMTSTRLPLMKMASVNAKNAGLNTTPICSLVM